MQWKVKPAALIDLNVVDGLKNLEELRSELNTAPETSPKSKKGRKRTKSQISKEIEDIKLRVEDLSDRKIQIATNAYDLIDQHMRVVEEELKLVDAAVAATGGTINKDKVISLYNTTKNGNNEASTEPLYCICREVSYGNMIECDNEDCPVEWFHYACVGLTKQPKNGWMCPQCSKKRKKSH